MLLIEHIIPKAVKKYKNICFIAVKSVYRLVNIPSIILENHYYENLSLPVADFQYCTEYEKEGLNSITILAHSADFATQKVQEIKALMKEYNY
jgi:hypothetical protein